MSALTATGGTGTLFSCQGGWSLLGHRSVPSFPDYQPCRSFLRVSSVCLGSVTFAFIEPNLCHGSLGSRASEQVSTLLSESALS